MANEPDPLESQREIARGALSFPAVLIAAVLLVRLVQCASLPVNTNDIARHLFYGLYVLKYGFDAAGVPLRILDPELSPVA